MEEEEINLFHLDKDGIKKIYKNEKQRDKYGNALSNLLIEIRKNYENRLNVISEDLRERNSLLFRLKLRNEKFIDILKIKAEIETKEKEISNNEKEIDKLITSESEMIPQLQKL
jgi:hypothetical protein